MPLFKKEILPEGEYLVTLPHGKRTLKTFTKDYLGKIVENFNRMSDVGLRVPAPFEHDPKALPVSEIPETNSFDNAGYWQELSIEDVDGKPTLFGVVNAPGNTDDMSTPAGKLANTIKEISACIKDSWTDGLGRDWGPSMLHGAPVINPVVPGQSEFTMMDGAIALSISGIVEDGPSTESIAMLAKELEDSVGIHLPVNTLPDDLIKVLIVSLKQHKLTSDQTIEDQEILDTQSIFMSLPEGTKMPLNQKQAEELVALGAINPKTKESFTVEDFDVDETPSVESRYNLALTAQLTDEKRNGLKGRVNNLVVSGRVTKEHAEAALFPEIDKYELSLGEDAKFKPNTIDLVVESLEALPAKEPVEPQSLMSNGLPTGSATHDGIPATSPTESKLTADEAEAMKKELLKELAV